MRDYSKSKSIPEVIKTLANLSGDPVVSIYFPLDTGTESASKANSIRLKNATQTVCQSLNDNGGPKTSLSKNVRELLDSIPSEVESWDSHGATIVIALSDDKRTIEYLGRKMSDTIWIDSVFMILPMLRLTPSALSTAVLDLNRERARLLILRDGRTDVIAISDEGIQGTPPNEHDRSGQLQQHTAGREADRRNGIFHGQDQSESTAEERQRRWVRSVASLVNTELKSSMLPLLFAGDDRLFGIYKSANKYDHFVTDHCLAPVSADGMAPSALEDVGNLKVRRVELEMQRLSSSVAAELGRNRGSSRVDTIAKAAENHRVDTLLISNDFDPSSGNGHENEDQHRADSRKINAAARATLMGGGRVFVVPEEAVPQGQLAAAFRY